MPEPKTFSEQLKKLREILGLDQAQVAQTFNQYQPWVAALEKRKSPPLNNKKTNFRLFWDKVLQANVLYVQLLGILKANPDPTIQGIVTHVQELDEQKQHALAALPLVHESIETEKAALLASISPETVWTLPLLHCVEPMTTSVIHSIVTTYDTQIAAWLVIGAIRLAVTRVASGTMPTMSDAHIWLVVFKSLTTGAPTVDLPARLTFVASLLAATVDGTADPDTAADTTTETT